MTWLTLSLGIAPSPDGHFGVMQIGDVPLKVRHWKREENGTISAEVADDEEWREFMERFVRLVSG